MTTDYKALAKTHLAALRELGSHYDYTLRSNVEGGPLQLMRLAQPFREFATMPAAVAWLDAKLDTVQEEADAADLDFEVKTPLR